MSHGGGENNNSVKTASHAPGSREHQSPRTPNTRRPSQRDRTPPVTAKKPTGNTRRETSRRTGSNASSRQKGGSRRQRDSSAAKTPNGDCTSIDSPSASPSRSKLKTVKNRFGKVLRKVTGASSREKKRQQEQEDTVTAIDTLELATAQAWFEETIDQGCVKIMERFKEVQRYTAKKTDCIAFQKNPEKNRYKDVVCIDESRVVLNDNIGSDYIHANYVKKPGPDNQPANRFICTQAPTQTTIIDFWRMVYQEKSGFILMLCNLVEGGKNKCTTYWPSKEGEEMHVGPFTIKAESRTKRVGGEKTEDVCLSIDLSVTKDQDGGDKLRLKHYQVASWPDKGIPTDGRIVPFLLGEVANEYKPVVVHCSAGIGRTGSLIVVDICLDKLYNDDDNLNVCEVVKRVRDQRMHSVQNEMQYLFIHYLLLNHLINERVVNTATRDYRHFNTAYLSLAAHSNAHPPTTTTPTAIPKATTTPTTTPKATTPINSSCDSS